VIKAVSASCIPALRFAVNCGIALRTIVELTKLMFATVIYGTAVPIWTVLVWGGYGIVYKGVVWGLVIRPIIGTIKIIWMTVKNTGGRLIWKKEDLGETTNWYRYLNGNQKKIEPPTPVIMGVGTFVRLKAGALAKYSDRSCLKYNPPGSTRIRIGKIIRIFDEGGVSKASVRCFNKNAGDNYDNANTSTYTKDDLEIAEKPEGFPDRLLGGYTRRQRVRGMPKRLKTRRTY
jgi:hypothetical protein